MSTALGVLLLGCMAPTYQWTWEGLPDPVSAVVSVAGPSGTWMFEALTSDAQETIDPIVVPAGLVGTLEVELGWEAGVPEFGQHQLLVVFSGLPVETGTIEIDPIDADDDGQPVGLVNEIRTGMQLEPSALYMTAITLDDPGSRTKENMAIRAEDPVDAQHLGLLVQFAFSTD